MSYRITTHSTFEDSVLYPKIFQIEKNLYAASFFLMKLLPAKCILETARKNHQLQPGATVVETTSGTFGLALALMCNRYGYRCILVSDPVLDPLLKNRIENLGAEVDIVEHPSPVGGYQKARLDRLQHHLDKHANSFWPRQYQNEGNPNAYALLAEYLSTMVGQIDCLVGPVGSGGSMCGTSFYLRKLNPDMHVVGVDTVNSVLFGQPDGPRLVRGLGNSIMPDILDHRHFDEIHWLTASETFCATRDIHKSHRLFVGVTGGAAYQVAHHYATQNPDQVTVFICPDEGYRYLDSAFSLDYLTNRGLYLEKTPQIPIEVETPVETISQWSMMHWNRRTLQGVLGCALEEA